MAVQRIRLYVGYHQKKFALLINGDTTLVDLFKEIAKRLKTHYGVSHEILKLQTNGYDVFPSKDRVDDYFDTKQEVKCYVKDNGSSNAAGAPTGAKGPGTPGKRKNKDVSDTEGSKPKKQKTEDATVKSKPNSKPGSKAPSSSDKAPISAVIPAVMSTPEHMRATTAKQQLASQAVMSLIKKLDDGPSNKTETPAKDKTNASTKEGPTIPPEQGEVALSSAKKRRKRNSTLIAAKAKASEGKMGESKTSENKEVEAKVDASGTGHVNGNTGHAVRKSRRTSSAINESSPKPGNRGKKQAIPVPTGRPKSAALKSEENTTAKAPESNAPKKSKGDMSEAEQKQALCKILKKNQMPDESTITKALNALYSGFSKSAKEKFGIKKVNSMFEEVLGTSLTKETKKVVSSKRKEIIGGN